jgi:hypothetical protein
MKIIKVVDTRKYEEIDDKWYPIPGSGDTNICDRCNKGHEVHYHVEVENKEIVVGGGCAKKEGLISDSQHKSLGSAIMTLSKNKAELEKLIKNFKIQSEIKEEVSKLEVPVITKEEFPAHGTAHWMVMGDERVLVHDRADLSERKDCLIRAWRGKRAQEKFKNIPGFKEVQEYMISDCKKRIEKAEKKIKKLMEIQ